MTRFNSVKEFVQYTFDELDAIKDKSYQGETVLRIAKKYDIHPLRREVRKLVEETRQFTERDENVFRFALAVASEIMMDIHIKDRYPLPSELY